MNEYDVLLEPETKPAASEYDILLGPSAKSEYDVLLSEPELTPEQVVGYGAQLQESAIGFGSPIGATARLGVGLGLPSTRITLPQTYTLPKEATNEEVLAKATEIGGRGNALTYRRPESGEHIFEEQSEENIEAGRERAIQEAVDIDKPLITLPKPESEALAGVAQAEAVLESFVTKRNVALMLALPGAPALIQKAVSAYFAGSMGKAALEKIPDVADAISKGELTEAGKGLVEFGANLLPATGAGVHFAGVRPKGGRIAEMDATRMAQDFKEAAKTPVEAPTPPQPPIVPEIAAEALPAPTVAQDATVAGATQGAAVAQLSPSAVPDYDPGNIGTRERINQKVARGKSREEAVAEDSAEIEATRTWVENNTKEGDLVQTSDGRTFRRDNEGKWNAVENGVERTGVKTTSSTLRGGTITQRGTRLKGDGTVVQEAAPAVVAPKTEAAPAQAPETVGGPAPFSPEGLQAPPSKRAGITAQPSFKEPTALKRALTTAVGWLRPRGHHPEEQYARLQVRDSEIAAGDRVIAYASRDLMTALKEQYGLSKVEMLGGGTKRIPAVDVQWMTRYLKGDPVAQNFVPPKVRGPLDTMRAAIDGKSQQVIDRLVADQRTLRPASPEWQRIQDTIDTVRGNMDLYVHRAYKFFDSKEPAPDWYNRLPAGVRQNAENYIAGSPPVPLPPLEARSRILDWLSDLKDQKVGSGKLGSKDPSILMHKHLSTPELRAVLGEYGSPLELYAKSMGKMTKWVANHRFLNDVRDMGMGRWLFEEGTNPPGFNARIAAEGSESMSPLNGLRTTHEIAQAFDSLYTSNTPWAATRWYYAVVAQSKFAATAQSLMTQSRNLLGRPMMALMAGHWNPKHVGAAGKAIWADLAGNDKRWQAFTKEAYDYGVLGDTAHGAEMQAILKDAALQDIDPASLYSWSLTRAAKQVGWKIPGDIYRASDDMGNLVGWLNEIDSQKSIHPHLSDAQIKQKAAGIVRDIYPTYSETPAVVQSFRKVPLTGAFVTFPYQTVRTAYNSTMRGLLEIRSANAAERVVGAKRLAGIATVLSSPFILQEISKLTTGVNTQQEDDYRSYQPDWSRNSRFAFLNQDSTSGELTAINLSYLDPYSYMTDPIMSAISSMRTDEPIDTAIARATHEFFRPWIDEQMVTRALVDSARNKTTTGREVYNETDAAYQKATAISRHIGEALTPGTIRRASTRIIPALKGEQTAYGRKLEPVTEIAREISGVALEKFNFKNGLAAKVKPFRDGVDDSEDVFRRAATQVATTSPAQIVEAYRTTEERRQSQYQTMRRFYLAAVRQGVDPEEAEEILESRGMSMRDIRNIAAGQYEPLKITPAIKKRAADIGRELPEDEIQSIQDEASSVTLD